MISIGARLRGMFMSLLEEVKTLLDKVLGLGGRAARFTADTPLLGSVPELDSMAVAGLIAALEEHFGLRIADDEIDAQTFATLGSLTAFIEHKLD